MKIKATKPRAITSHCDSVLKARLHQPIPKLTIVLADRSETQLLFDVSIRLRIGWLDQYLTVN